MFYALQVNILNIILYRYNTVCLSFYLIAILTARRRGVICMIYASGRITVFRSGPMELVRQPK